MGTRGHLGGLAEATLQALLLLDAAGKELVFLETVGTGQSEVEVIGIADTVLLVLMPGSGDSVQALKAGIMEIPDVIAINKLDHPAAKTMLNEVRSILSLDPTASGGRRSCSPRRRAARTCPSSGRRSRSTARSSRSRGGSRSGGAQNLAGEVFSVASARAKRHLEHAVADDPGAAATSRRGQRRELDPLSAVREILEKVFHIGSDGDSTRTS